MADCDVRYVFDEYALDANRRELFHGTRQVPVEPQVFDLLLYLIRNRERVVGKDDLLASVWQGRIVSESALSTRINAARSVLGDSGETQRLIKTLPRKGLRFVGAVREEPDGAHIATVAPPAASTKRPSIAVLPFWALNNDPGQDYFADGVAEDIITALSRNRAFFVIARNSSFTYKGRQVDTAQVARELGVEYILEGSVRRSGVRMRIAAQLIEAESGRHLWAEKFDTDVSDIFDVQDQIAVRVVGAIAPQLEKAEIARANRRATGDLAAYNLYLCGLARWNRWSKDDNTEALRLFYAAMEKDCDFSTPYGLAASCFQFAKANNWASSFDENEIARLVERAAEIGNDDAVALCWAGHVHAYFFKDVDRALSLIDRALDLDINLATAWQRSGWVRGYAGEPEAAVESLNKAMLLNPLDTRVFLTQSAMAFAHFVAGRDEESSHWAAMALRLKPHWLPALRMAVASNAMQGRRKQASEALAAYIRIDPEVSIKKICGCYPFRRASDRERLIVALRKAGLPG
jgi:TolB-like protein